MYNHMNSTSALDESEWFNFTLPLRKIHR